MMIPQLRHVAELHVEVGAPITIGETRDGVRRIIPINGGRIRGAGLNGIVVPGGADYQLIRADGFTTLDARYALKLDDGASIYIVNTGVRCGEPEVMASITRGEIVDPDRVYFRTTPSFETESAEHRWMTRSLFVASGARYPDRVELNFFVVD
ncbi:DUF3237 domain-containing protein [Paludibacterium yongneupense]|uniref:DUF3237 domain-containing protein n=1 Tax=Paludibacterium yongneupense TaxID=400061 RepID=UPI0003F4B063|nr:DUF3237 domain-containing protein [Paludibacterium yongneupense]